MKTSNKNAEFSFQVNTFGLHDVKKMLVDLYEKNVGPPGSINNYLNNSGHIYLQFSSDPYWVITHNAVPYRPETFPIISIEQAVEFLTNYEPKPKPEFVEVELNNAYTARVYKNRIVTGRQEFDISVIDKLAEALKSLDS